MTLSFDHLKAFFYAVKYGSLKKASLYLNISLSAVSNQIILLEKELSLKLMIRNKAGVKLTADGKKLFDRIKNTIPDLQAVSELYVQDDTISGDIVLDTWPGIAAFAIANQIKDFLDNYKNVRLIIKCRTADAPFEEWHSDVSIRPYVEQRPDLQQTLLFGVNFHLYASRAYLEKYGHPYEFKDLDKHRLISAFDTIDSTLNNETDWHLTIGTDKIRKPTFVVNSSIGILQAINDGVGIGALPTYYNPENQGLIRLFHEVEAPTINFYYIYPAYLQNIKRIKHLEKYLKQTLTLNT